MVSSSVMWFRRDLRLRDNPALLAACASDRVVPLFVLDPHLWSRAGVARRAYLVASLTALDRSLGGALVVREGDPREVVPAVAAEVSADAVHLAADYGPYGSRRDEEVEEALGDDVALERLGSPYAVAPGRIKTRATRRTRSTRPSSAPGPSTAGAPRSTPPPTRPGRT